MKNKPEENTGIDLIDVLIFGGIGCIGLGVWTLSGAAALITIGSLLVLGGIALLIPRRK